MEIQSAVSSGIEGFHKAIAVADQAAKEILAQTTLKSSVVANDSLAVNSSSELSTNNTATLTSNSITTPSSNISDLNQSLVNLKVAEYQASASAQVIKSADESLGTLLDVTA